MSSLARTVLVSTIIMATAAGNPASAGSSPSTAPSTGQYLHCYQYLGSPIGITVKTRAIEVTEAVLEIVRTSDPHVAVGRVAISDRGSAFIGLEPTAGKASFEFFHAPYPGTPSSVTVVRSPIMPKWLELRPCSSTDPHVP